MCKRTSGMLKLKPIFVLIAIVLIGVLITRLSGAEGFSTFDVSACSQSITRDCNSCSGNNEGRCEADRPGVWNNGISSDGDAMAGGPPNGKPRVFKLPSYYGFGAPSPFSYGEPYYVRSVKY